MENWEILIHLLVTVFLYFFGMFLVNPAVTDVTMEAVCPGEDECSLSIYLTGFQQAAIGLGSMILTPLMGYLSDNYGRKPFLTIPLILSIIPHVILASKRTTPYFYAYYVMVTLTAMVSNSGVVCISLGYLADNVSKRKRVSAFGIFFGVISAGTVFGNLGARLLPINLIFQVAAVSCAAAAIYMVIFLKDTTWPVDATLEQPILKKDIGATTIQAINQSLIEKDAVKEIPLTKNTSPFLKNSLTVSLASLVAFFNSLAEAGSADFLMYYLKARFHFQKHQQTDIWLICSISTTISNIVLMPTLGSLLGEETLLCIGLFAGFLQMLLYSIAWSSGVSYASASLTIFLALANSSIRCIISKQVSPNEQGIAQGCILGIGSFAKVVSPLIYSPLSALFLSEAAPFKFPGFSMLCIGLAWLVGFSFSTMIKGRPHWCRDSPRNDKATSGLII